MSLPKVVAGAFLASTARWMRQREASLTKIGGDLVELDIKACRRQALFGAEWAERRDKIQSELSKLGMSEDKWTKDVAKSDISQMRRRVRLYRNWDQYLVARRKAGDTGYSGLHYALSLVADRIDIRMARGASLTRSGPALTKPTAGLDLSRCTFLSGDALAEQKKLPPKSVDVIITSPPYFPMKRDYGVKGCVGREPTLKKYIARLVTIFRESRRVLKDDGILWIVVDDSYSRRGGTWTPDSVNARRPSHQKSTVPSGVEYQGTLDERPTGNLLFIPARLAMALQDDGWICRAEIIWWKGPRGLRAGAPRRPRRDFEKVLMFTTTNGHQYDHDPLREVPSHAGSHDFRVLANPMGRIGGSIWSIPPAIYLGNHPATFPQELVRRMLAVSCVDPAVALDPLGGPGTVAMVALQMGHRAITIDLNPAYTEEARQRIANAPPTIEPLADNDDEWCDVPLAAD